jgi:hypothetical protein
MQNNKIQGFLKNFTLFQWTVLAWLLVLSIIVAVVSINLLRARIVVNSTLAQAADDIIALADDHIRYTVKIDQTVPISTNIVIDEEILVPVSLEVNHTITVENEIPFQQEIDVPVNLEIDELFPIDTTVPFKDEITVPIDEVITIDEKFGIPIQVPLYGEAILDIPIRADIPVEFDVQVPIDRNIPVETNIPVKFPISKTLTVEIDRNVPIEMEIPVSIPVKTEVTVLFSRTIPIEVDVPIVMDIPLDIAISETPFGDYLRDLGESLRQMATEY